MSCVGFTERSFHRACPTTSWAVRVHLLWVECLLDSVCVVAVAAGHRNPVLCVCVRAHAWGVTGQCALAKVQASKTFEYCAREASQILGGSSIVKEGKGKVIERLYRDVRASAIPGGSEEILLDFAIRQAVTKAKKLHSKL